MWYFSDISVFLTTFSFFESVTDWHLRLFESAWINPEKYASVILWMLWLSNYYLHYSIQDLSFLWIWQGLYSQMQYGVQIHFFIPETMAHVCNISSEICHIVTNSVQVMIMMFMTTVHHVQISKRRGEG